MADGEPAPEDQQDWRRALAAMVAVQFLMAISFNIVSPIMPLALPGLGVDSAAAVNMWAGVLASEIGRAHV